MRRLAIIAVTLGLLASAPSVAEAHLAPLGVSQRVANAVALNNCAPGLWLCDGLYVPAYYTGQVWGHPHQRRMYVAVSNTIGFAWRIRSCTVNVGHNAWYRDRHHFGGVAWWQCRQGA